MPEDTSLFENFLQNIQYKVEAFSGEVELNISLWGNTVEDHLYYHFDMDSCERHLTDYDIISEKYLDVFLIMAPINLQQVTKIKKTIEDLKYNPIIIYIEGKPLKGMMAKSYQYVPNIEAILDIDFFWKKQSLDVNELFHHIVEQYLKKRNHLHD